MEIIHFWACIWYLIYSTPAIIMSLGRIKGLISDVYPHMISLCIQQTFWSIWLEEKTIGFKLNIKH